MRLRGLLGALVGLVVLGLPTGASAAGTCPNEGLREAQGSTFLAECRAYEMVSPVEKGGVDVIANPMRTRSSVDGNALVYSAIAAFGDAQGINQMAEYAARRGADGWVSHGITPAQEPSGGALISPPFNQTQLVGELSSDLSTGVMYALRSLTGGAPNVAQVPNLYLRKDILAGPPGSYELLSNSVTPLERHADTFRPETFLAGTSEDFQHVIFESTSNLTADAFGSAYKLYEWENGIVRLAAILPDGTPAVNSTAGRGARQLTESSSSYTLNMISRDGSRVFFTDQEAGMIYVREHHSTTTRLNLSELSSPEAPQPAELWNVTPDGSKVFFTTPEKLTEDDDFVGTDLYMYNFDAPAGHRLTVLSHVHEPGEQSVTAIDVLGISEDGSYIYFRVGTGGVSVMKRVYVWHDGSTHLIGSGGQQLEEIGAIYGSGTYLRVSPGGSLAYTTAVPQTSYDTACTAKLRGACYEVYVYDPAMGHVVCASCNPSGAVATGDAYLSHITQKGLGGLGGYGRNQHQNRAITDNGERVFFDSPGGLVPQDTNGTYDVYEYDVPSGEVRLISSGQSGDESYFQEASPDGRDVFFATRQRLVSQDVDDNLDIYDARVDGGIPAQNQAPVVGCVGDACQGSPGGAPSFGAPSSLTLSGSGNLPGAEVVGKAKPKKAKSKPKKKTSKKAKGKKRRKARAKKPGGLGKSVSRRAGR